jgi:hypothetical protein
MQERTYILQDRVGKLYQRILSIPACSGIDESLLAGLHKRGVSVLNPAHFAAGESVRDELWFPRLPRAGVVENMLAYDPRQPLDEGNRLSVPVIVF